LNLLHLTHSQLGTTGNTALSLVYTRITVLSLHYSYPGNGFITVPLSLQIIHAVLFSHPNSFRTIILELPSPKTRLSSIPLLPNSYPGRLSSRNSTTILWVVASYSWTFRTDISSASSGPKNKPSKKPAYHLLL
jgi:hypothetical protein